MSDTSEANTAEAARRPLKSRQTKWAAVSSTWLARKGVTPNAISLISIGFAAVAGAGYAACAYSPSPVLTSVYLVIACVGIQGRLLCNLLDGMVAIEGGKKSKSGELYNDAPDRIADAIILAAAGYAAGTAYGPTLGWLAVVGALMTAYLRVLGRSLGAGIYFIGPMAKPHRMATLTAANLVGALLTPWGWHRWVLVAALVILVLGTLVTCIRRLTRVVHDLESRP